MRGGILAILTALVVVPVAAAQDNAWRFRWETGQVLTYRTEHVTTAAFLTKEGRQETLSKLKLLKRWQVIGVDARGVATLQLTLAAMRNEQTLFNGETLLFDSADPDKGTPGLKESLQQYVGKPLAVLRVNPSGKVLEAKLGSPAQYEAEPPFLLTLPASAVAAGAAWQREYLVTLSPPQGTGEQYPAVQNYTCKSIDGPLATVQLQTTFKTLPDSPQDRIPLFQKQPTGEIVFDTRNGRLHRARLYIQQQLDDIQGAGSSYRFESVYTEEYVP